MANKIDGAPSKIKAGAVKMDDHIPVKIVDARPERKTLILTLSAIDVAIGDASITSAQTGGFVPHLEQFELQTADEVWGVVRDGRTLGQVISYIEMYD